MSDRLRLLGLWPAAQGIVEARKNRASFLQAIAKRARRLDDAALFVVWLIVTSLADEQKGG